MFDKNCFGQYSTSKHMQYLTKVTERKDNDRFLFILLYLWCTNGLDHFMWFLFGWPSWQYSLVKTASGQHRFGTFIFRLARSLISLTRPGTRWCYPGFVRNKKMSLVRLPNVGMKIAQKERRLCICIYIYIYIYIYITVKLDLYFLFQIV